MDQVIVIGISGVTNGGKTSLAQKLKDNIPNVKIISQDGYFWPGDDPKHVWLPNIKHANYDIVSSLDMEKMCHDIQLSIGKRKRFLKLKQGQQSQHINVTNHVLHSLSETINQHKIEIILIEGFLLFNYEPALELFDFKYYITLDYDECKRRRLKRTYDPPDLPGYFEECVWPEYEKHLQEIKWNVIDVHYLDGTANNNFEIIISDLYSSLLNE